MKCVEYIITYSIKSVRFDQFSKIIKIIIVSKCVNNQFLMLQPSVKNRIHNESKNSIT